MSPLNIHPEEVAPVAKKKKSKTLKVMLGLAALVLIPVIGTTFAATIGINGGGNNTVQFAQGSIATAACDSTMTVTAGSAYLTVGSPTAVTAFYLKKITISGIELGDGGCVGKTLVVSADAEGTEPALIGTDTQLSIPISTASTLGTLSPTPGFTAAISGSGGSGQIVITISDPKVLSEDVDKFLIQSS
jgi:hypothetical protein